MVLNPLHGVERARSFNAVLRAESRIHYMELKAKRVMGVVNGTGWNPLHGVESTSAKTPVCSNSS